MNREDIIRMAKEAEIAEFFFTNIHEGVVQQMERFAAIVAEHERKKRHAAWHEGFEAGRNAERNFCAAVAEWTPDVMGTAQKIAAAIRARGQA